MAAPRNKFSKEQIEILQANRYVLDASAARVLFTGEFKERFWELYTVEKMWPVQILRELDVDPMILGAARIRGIPQSLKREHRKNGVFLETRRKRPPERRKEQPLEQEVNRLSLEVEYLRQEQEFIKKILSAAQGGRLK